MKLKMKHWIVISIVVLLAACGGQNRNADGIAAAAQSSDSVMQAHGYEVLPLLKTRTGHVTATLRVNGKPCLFLIDTGGGATLIDISKKDKYQLDVLAATNYAAGIGSASLLVRTSAVIGIKDATCKDDSLYLMDIDYLNAEFRKQHSRPVDGVMGTDFLEKHHAVINYPHARLYLKAK